MSQDENPVVGSPVPQPAARHEPVDLTQFGDFDITRATEYQGEANRRSISLVVWKAGLFLFVGVVMLVAALFTRAPWWAYLMIGLYILIPSVGIFYWQRIYRRTDPSRPNHAGQGRDDESARGSRA